MGSNRDYLSFLPNLKSSATIQVKFTCATQFLAVLYHKGKIFCFPRVIQVLYPDGRGLIFLGALKKKKLKLLNISSNKTIKTNKYLLIKPYMARRISVFDFLRIEHLTPFGDFWPTFESGAALDHYSVLIPYFRFKNLVVKSSSLSKSGLEIKIIQLYIEILPRSQNLLCF